MLFRCEKEVTLLTSFVSKQIDSKNSTTIKDRATRNNGEQARRGRRGGGRTETDEFRSEAKRREYLEMGQSGALLRFDDNEPKVMPLGVCFSAPGK